MNGIGKYATETTKTIPVIESKRMDINPGRFHKDCFSE